jgi:hypothetical protein
MANPTRLDLVHKAICSGILGNIQWKDAAAQLVRDDPEVAGLTPEGIRVLLRQFVTDGNSLDVRQETRAEFLQEDPDDPYWYRAVIPVAELPRGLFVEVKLINDEPDDPWVEIVNAHRQRS